MLLIRQSCGGGISFCKVALRFIVEVIQIRAAYSLDGDPVCQFFGLKIGMMREDPDMPVFHRPTALEETTTRRKSRSSRHVPGSAPQKPDGHSASQSSAQAGRGSPAPTEGPTPPQPTRAPLKPAAQPLQAMRPETMKTASTLQGKTKVSGNEPEVKYKNPGTANEGLRALRNTHPKVCRD